MRSYFMTCAVMMLISAFATASTTVRPVGLNLPQSAYSTSRTQGNRVDLWGPQFAFDNNPGYDAGWHAGVGGQQWVEVDLGDEYSLSSADFFVRQLPDGVTHHEIWGSAAPIQGVTESAQLLGTINVYTQDRQTLFKPIASSNTVRYVNIRTVSSPSWIGWPEITLNAKVADWRTANAYELFKSQREWVDAVGGQSQRTLLTFDGPTEVHGRSVIDPAIHPSYAHQGIEFLPFRNENSTSSVYPYILRDLGSNLDFQPTGFLANNISPYDVNDVDGRAIRWRFAIPTNAVGMFVNPLNDGDGGYFEAFGASGQLLARVVLEPGVFSGIITSEPITNIVAVNTFNHDINWGLVNLQYALVSRIPGDYNNSGSVDAADYTIWRDNLGSISTLPNDTTPGSVAEEDYSVWRENYGAVSSLNNLAAANVPEPGTIALGVGFIVLLTCFPHRSNGSERCVQEYCQLKASDG